MQQKYAKKCTKICGFLLWIYTIYKILCIIFYLTIFFIIPIKIDINTNKTSPRDVISCHIHSS